MTHTLLEEQLHDLQVSSASLTQLLFLMKGLYVWYKKVSRKKCRTCFTHGRTYDSSGKQVRWTCCNCSNFRTLTGVTQLLEQVNKTLHLQYKQAKSNLFTSHVTINREGFMLILANMWREWTSKDSLQRAGKHVGICNEGLNVNWMQTDKFIQAKSCMETEENSPDTSCSSITVQCHLLP